MEILDLSSVHIDKISFPENSSGRVPIVNGKKEGIAEVIDGSNNLCAKLTFVNDQMNGIALFFVNNKIIRKCIYENNLMNGVCCDYKEDIELERFMYVNGNIKSKLVKIKDLNTYWKEIDLETGNLISYCKFNENLELDGKRYKYKDGTIELISVYADGQFLYDCKVFNDKEMKEFDQEGNIIYIGEFKDSLVLDYPRHGVGTEYKRNEKYYSGSWRINLPNGHGILFDNADEKYNGTWDVGVIKVEDNCVFDYSLQSVMKNIPDVYDNFVHLTKDSTDLIFVPNIYKTARNLTLNNYQNLRTVAFSSGVLENITSLEICDNPRLSYIKCGNSNRENAGDSIIITNAVVLRSITPSEWI